MDIEIGVTIENRLDISTTVQIPAGSVFEVDSADRGVQNVIAVEDNTVRLGARSTRRVRIWGRCLNRSRGVPVSVPGRPTPFRYAGGSMNQDEIWQDASNPI